MKNSFILFTFLLFNCAVNAQSVKIKGQLADSLEGPIPGASVMLIGAQDSILKSFAVTDAQGYFALSNVKAGEYVLKASFFGYIPSEMPIKINEVGNDIEIGKIFLSSKTLNTVVIEGEYIPIQIKGDTVEYDARAFIVKEQDMVEDLLLQMPGIEVEADGTIKAQGKEVQKITIDGEEFFGNDPKIAAKNIPANAVSKVQVFDKTSDEAQFTGVDDGEETTTINIKLKDNRKQGSFGNFDLAGGIDIPYQDLLRYRMKGNVHYFKGKWQASLIGMSNNVNETGFSFDDYMNFMGGAQNMMKNGGFDRGGSGAMPMSAGDANDGFLNTHSTGINLNYKPSDKTVLTSSIFLSAFDKSYQKDIYRLTYFTDSTMQTNEVNEQESRNLTNNMTLRLEQKFDSTRFLTFDFNGSWSSADYYSRSFIENFNKDGNNASDFDTRLSQTNFDYNFTGKLNYRKKFNKDGRYTGGGITYGMTNNDYTTGLDYLNTLYLTAGTSAFQVVQNQYQITNTTQLNANWMYSEPISARMLLQLELSHSRNTELRNKTVNDIVASSEVVNDLLSAQGDYLFFSHNAELTHKFIGVKSKTTIGAQYKYLNLSGDSIFSSPHVFSYVLPSAQWKWEIGKKADFRLNYNTNITTPSLNQLQPLPNNTNPSEIVLGNVDLRPEYTHSVSARFHSFNQFNFTFFMASISGNYTQNNITYAQTINAFFVKELTPENIGVEKSLNGYLVYGTSLYPLKTKFKISNNVTVSNGLVNLNNTQDQYTSFFNSARLSIENIGKKVFNVRTGIGATYGKNTYRDNDAFNNDYLNYDYFAQFEWYIKDRWIFKTDMTHYFYPSFTTNNQIMILNTSLAVNLLKSRKLQVYVSGIDLLNQNTGINQYYIQNLYEQAVTQTLARYVLLGVKYSFQKLGVKE